MFELYPLGLRSGKALWNTSTARYDWPLEWQLADVDVVRDGGINRPAICLTPNSGGVRRLFHIGAIGNQDEGVVGSYSDDNGQTWTLSVNNATVPGRNTPGGMGTFGKQGRCGALPCGGGEEPSTVELSNGTLWTMIRVAGGGTQGFDNSTLWQAFSDDRGESFRSTPTASKIISYDAPVSLLRLRRSSTWRTPSQDGREPQPILLIWNNAREQKVVNGMHVWDPALESATRALLHAAISFDDGKSFVGHREVMRDPLIKVKQIPSDDHGVG